MMERFLSVLIGIIHLEDFVCGFKSKPPNPLILKSLRTRGGVLRDFIREIKSDKETLPRAEFKK